MAHNNNVSHAHQRDVEITEGLQPWLPADVINVVKQLAKEQHWMILQVTKRKNKDHETHFQWINLTTKHCEKKIRFPSSAREHMDPSIVGGLLPNTLDLYIYDVSLYSSILYKLDSKTNQPAFDYQAYDIKTVIQACCTLNKHELWALYHIDVHSYSSSGQSAFTLGYTDIRTPTNKHILPWTDLCTIYYYRHQGGPRLVVSQTFDVCCVMLLDTHTQLGFFSTIDKSWVEKSEPVPT
jgi:hypothetical protein